MAFRAMSTERRALLASAAGALLIAVVGVVWGLAARTQVILLDGVYALIGLGLSWLGLRALSAVEKGPSARYPFGREALGPLVVGAQGLVLLGTFGYALIEAVATIIDGGSDAELSAALVYAVLSVIFSFLLRWYLRRNVGTSELVAAEVTQWTAGAWLSAAMVGAFVAALAVERTEMAWLAAYFDPALVIVCSAAFLPAPVRMLRTTFAELVEAAPPAFIAAPVEAGVADIRLVYGLPEPTVRMSKLGRKLYLELDFVIGDRAWTVAQGDELRRTLVERLSNAAYELWLNVEVHVDDTWDV